MAKVSAGQGTEGSADPMDWSQGTKGTASASNKRQLALANEDDQETSSSTSNNNKGQGKAPAVSSNKKARLDKSVVSKSKQSEVLRKAVRDLLKDLASYASLMLYVRYY